MRALVLCLLSVWGLAACGADGEPVQPTANVDVTVGSNGGVYTSTRVGASGGWWNVTLGKVF